MGACRATALEASGRALQATTGMATLAIPEGLWPLKGQTRVSPQSGSWHLPGILIRALASGRAAQAGARGKLPSRVRDASCSWERCRALALVHGGQICCCAAQPCPDASDTGDFALIGRAPSVGVTT
jgi:hypothetical protein